MDRTSNQLSEFGLHFPPNHTKYYTKRLFVFSRISEVHCPTHIPYTHPCTMHKMTPYKMDPVLSNPPIKSGGNKQSKVLSKGNLTISDRPVVSKAMESKHKTLLKADESTTIGLLRDHSNSPSHKTVILTKFSNARLTFCIRGLYLY